MWEIDEENGAYVRGMRPGITTSGAFFANYTLEFDTKIDKGGIGWAVVRCHEISTTQVSLHLPSLQ